MTTAAPSTLDATAPEAGLPFPVPIPFVEHLGLRLLRWQDGEAVLAFDPAPEHLNSFSVVHGGVGAQPPLRVTHLRFSKGQRGGAVQQLASGAQRPHGGAHEAGFHLDGDGTPITGLHAAGGVGHCHVQQRHAHATGTFKYVKRLPVGSKSSQPLNAAGAVATD